MPYGAFVKVKDDVDALLHISKMAEHRVERVTDVVQRGDKVKVRIIKIDGNKVDVTMKGVRSGGDPAATGGGDDDQSLYENYDDETLGEDPSVTPDDPEYCEEIHG